jgi:hypothetical protein
MIIAANKSSKEVIDDESRAFYEERFQYSAVNWDTHTAQDYFKLLKLSLLILIRRCCFMSKLFEDNHANLTIRPLRIAIDITKVYINKGIDFIGNFSISTANIAQIKAAAARSITSNQYPSCSKSFVIYSVKSAKDHRLVGLHALKLLNSIKVTDDTMSVVMEAKRQ